MDWFSFAWIFGGIGVFIWIILAARKEAELITSRQR